VIVGDAVASAAEPRQDSRMTDSEGIAPTLPGLDSENISISASKWDDGGLWRDVGVLSDRFWSTSSESDRLVAWHHLVLAVGNFKRQGGSRLQPAALSSSTTDVSRQGSLSVPGTDPALVIGVDDATSWARLSEALPGAAVATTTTLLAALWPDRHFIFDRRVHGAANGLRLAAGLSPTPDLDVDSAVSAAETFGTYAVVRGWVLATAEITALPVADVERALYQLDREADRGAVRGRSWRKYSTALVGLVGSQERST
jgi:hypothetical protein